MSTRLQLLIILLVVVFVAAMLLWYPFQQSGTPMPSGTLTYDHLQKIVTSQGVIKLPVVVFNTTISRDQLPADLTGLVFPNSQNLRIQRLRYDGGKLGYSISYIVPVSFDVTNNNFFSLLQISPWQLLKNAKTSVFAITDAQDLTTKVRVSQNPVTRSSTAVVIQSIPR